MNYKEIIKDKNIEGKDLGGRVNSLKLYEIEGKKIVLLGKKIHDNCPKDCANVPRLLEVPDEKIWWMDYMQQKEYSELLKEKANLNVISFLEVGKDYAIREFVESPTLAQKIEKGHFESVYPWISKIAYAHKKGIPLADRNSSNTLITEDNEPLFFDFDIRCSEKEFVLSQSIFYSLWLSAKPEKLKDSMKDLQKEFIKDNSLDKKLLNKYLKDFTEKVIAPLNKGQEKIFEDRGRKLRGNRNENSILHRIETNPLIKNYEERLELRERVKGIISNIF